MMTRTLDNGRLKMWASSSWTPKGWAVELQTVKPSASTLAMATWGSMA